MVYRGHIQNGEVVLDEQVTLPDGTVVLIEPIILTKSKTLAEQFQDIIGCISDLPSDMAENHNHYIH
jgi:hypothetical protein